MLHFGVQIEIIVYKQQLQLINQYLLNNYLTLLQMNTDPFKYNKTKRINGSVFFTQKTIWIYENKKQNIGIQLKSKKLQYNEENISLLKQLLIYLKQNKYIDYNSSCGFHVHSSIQDYSILQHQLLLYKFLNEYKYKQNLYIGKIKMTNDIYGNLQYCKKRYLYKLRYAIQNESTCKYLDDSQIKSCLYKIHNKFNTIQWRGLNSIFSQYINIDDVILAMQQYFTTLMELQIDKTLAKYIK